jgi:hypothetical protein
METKKMTESIKALLEQRHNVNIDAEAEMYTTEVPNIDNRYGALGWQGIPAAWVAELRCVVTGCGKIVDNEGDFLCAGCARS